MQSSFVTLVRALVMLGCLAVIPLIAVFGTSLPARVVEFLDSHLAARAASAEPLGEAPAFNLRGPTGSAEPGELTSIQTSPGAELGHPNSRPTITQASFSSGERALRPHPVLSSADMVPVVRDRAAAVPTSHRCDVEGDLGLGSTEPIKEIERRLQQLGATYYRLERWGKDGDVYHFFCKVPIGGNPNFTRHFDETHTSPDQAMRNVLEQIENWRKTP
jgi:hypothetical protein